MVQLNYLNQYEPVNTDIKIDGVDIATDVPPGTIVDISAENDIPGTFAVEVFETGKNNLVGDDPAVTFPLTSNTTWTAWGTFLSPSFSFYDNEYTLADPLNGVLTFRHTFDAIGVVNVFVDGILQWTNVNIGDSTFNLELAPGTHTVGVDYNQNGVPDDVLNVDVSADTLTALYYNNDYPVIEKTSQTVTTTTQDPTPPDVTTTMGPDVTTTMDSTTTMEPTTTSIPDEDYRRCLKYWRIVLDGYCGPSSKGASLDCSKQCSKSCRKKPVTKLFYRISRYYKHRPGWEK
jgi:hypothetical protein